jgi:DNA-binding LytR/AlgR family response regulator
MNCIIVDDDKLSRRIIEEYVKKTESLRLVGSFANAMEAINFVSANEAIDLIFLDIEMPEMTGLEFLNSLASMPQVIIISSKEKYAFDAFDYNVTDYLLKPVAYSRFFRSIDKAIKIFNKNTSSFGTQDSIFIKRNLSLVKLRFEDILWVEALENYVSFYTDKERFTVHFTLKAIEKKLPPTKFIRVHRSYIVNVSAIISIEENNVIISANKENHAIPIGKSYRDKLMQDINSIR